MYLGYNISIFYSIYNSNVDTADVLQHQVQMHISWQYMNIYTVHELNMCLKHQHLHKMKSKILNTWYIGQHNLLEYEIFINRNSQNISHCFWENLGYLSSNLFFNLIMITVEDLYTVKTLVFLQYLELKLWYCINFTTQSLMHPIKLKFIYSIC